MEEVKVSDDKGAQEPVAQMDCVIMIEIANPVCPCELTIIVIRMLSLSDFLI
jgi:hypothetical protein